MRTIRISVLNEWAHSMAQNSSNNLPFLLSPHISVTVFFFVRRILVADISGVGWHRAMKFCRMVDLGVHQVFSPLVNFGPGVSPRPKSEKSIMHWTVVGQVRQTGRAVARPV